MHSSARSDRPSGFALLATRISGWTTRFILSGIILVGGLVFGRQVLRWWAEEDAAPAEPALRYDGLGDETMEHILCFGEGSWSIRRQVISGDVQSAVAALREKCRRATVAGTIPQGQPGAQERRLLISLAGRRPVEQCRGQWQVFQLDEAIPLVVGVREMGTTPTLPGEERIAEDDRRVVTWGLGVPAADHAWTLYTFVAATPAGEFAPGVAAVPLPPECRRTLSMRVEGGGGIVAFRGPVRPESWKGFFDEHFRTRDWRPDGGWQRVGARWSNRYVGSGAPTAAAVDVQFGPDERGGQTGLMVISPSTIESREGNGL